jgi:hypothetical protein
MKNTPLINILVRTSNRPNFFSNCYNSIGEQDYKNIRLIVSYDDELTKDYLKDYQVDALVEFNRLEDWSSIAREVFLPGYMEKPFPPNEYFNKMMKYTKPGYILYLDDDNKFSSTDSLSKIVSKITSERQMLLWRVQFPGYLIPDNQHFGQVPECCQIDTAGFTFHTNYIKHAQWDGYNYSDFRTALSLFLHIPQKVFINEVLIELQKTPGSGLRNDLPTENLATNEI